MIDSNGKKKRHPDDDDSEEGDIDSCDEEVYDY
jgi:hypothetical protein